MIIFSIMLVISLGLTFLAHNFLCAYHVNRKQLVEAEFRKVIDQLQELEAKRKKLTAKLSALEEEITFSQNEQAVILPEPVAKDSDDDHKNSNKRMSNYMLEQNIINEEQSAKAMKIMDRLQMDFATACLTLGFINEKMTTQLKKQMQ